MLKRQRPATPPPSSLGDLPSFVPNGPIRPFQPLHAAELPQPRSKRQRTQPPPLDGALRGWPKSESDGEEDWIEDTHSTLRPPLPPSMVASQYKDANSLLHELHVLNQHRLLFAHPRRLNPSPRVPLSLTHAPIQERRPMACQPAPSQVARDELTGQSCRGEFVDEKGLAEEFECVRQRYEGTNRLLGSLFLSRRREVEEMASSADPGPSS